jgi:two-component system, LytTR family, response regulator
VRTESRRLRAVICDDDTTVRRVVTTMAEQAGFHVIGEAALALDALALVEMTRPHAVVLDLSMMGMSGTEVIAPMRAAVPEIAIIVYTAFDTMAELAKAEGVFAVVRKDEPGKLEDALRRVAGDHRFPTTP